MTPWIKQFNSKPDSTLRLFCFPHAGGSASVFYPWNRLFPANIEVCAIQLPGREERIAEPVFKNFRALVESLESTLQPCLDKPFAFFGHSLGALIAYETARKMQSTRSGLPFHLFASACRAPHIPKKTPDIHQLSDPEFIEEIKQYKGIPESVLQHRELMELMLPILRADFTLNEVYSHTPGPPLDCPICAYCANEDPGIQIKDMEKWQNHTTSDFLLRLFPGGHFYIFDNPKQVIQSIIEDIDSSFPRL
jgi:medium-chain acyl-[acyl-carrier-protein] hydrolase